MYKTRRKMMEPSFADTEDFTNADRGFIGALSPCIIKTPDGRVVWNNDEYAFLQDQCPETVNPKLWRQGQLLSKQGLYEVTKGIYQVRGFDISNVSFVEGQTGVIVIDPLVSTECAAAAFELYKNHRGKREVTAVIYSHSHADHFGGAAGVLGDKHQGIPIIAPEGFMEEALGENVLAGPAMRRRAAFMYGSFLPKNPKGQIGVGLGMGTSRGSTSLIPPNVIIKKTGQELVVDGVKVLFQMVPETEAPSEMNFFFPDFNALLVAECATHGMHNIITLRGALVRDSKAWSRYLDETIVLYGDKSDVLFASHGWPTWERVNLITFLEDQRDLYAYLHDQTLRLMNLGMTGIEIAEKLTLPPRLLTAWHTQGYYGSLSHNVKGIYQRYMTWFDGKPEHLWQYPPKEEGERYVDCFGGIEGLNKKAEQYASEGDLRFAATLLGHAIAAQPTHERSKALLALVFERLGHGSENATWRNFYLTGAVELCAKKTLPQNNRGVTAFAPLLSVDQWFEELSVMIDGERAAENDFAVNIHVQDDQKWRLIVSNGALTYRQQPGGLVNVSADCQISLSKQELHRFLSGDVKLAEANAVGNVGLLHKLLHLTGIVEPSQL